MSINRPDDALPEEIPPQPNSELIDSSTGSIPGNLSGISPHGAADIDGYKPYSSSMGQLSDYNQPPPGYSAEIPAAKSADQLTKGKTNDGFSDVPF